MSVRLAVRTLRRSPAYVATVVCTIALTITLAATTFAIVDGVLFEPLPYRDADRVFQVRGSDGRATAILSPLDVTYLAEADPRMSLSGISTTAALRHPDRPDVRIWSVSVDRSFFEVLGQPPLAGGFTDDHYVSGGVEDAVRPAIVSHAFWQQWLAADPAAIGRIVDMVGSRVLVAGILPQDFVFPSSFSRTRPDLLFPATSGVSADRWSRSLDVIARLPGGVTVAQAKQRLDAVLAARAHEYKPRRIVPGPYVAVEMRSIAEVVGRAERPLFRVAFGGAMLLILLGAINITGLVAARTRNRRSELSTRSALGANRHHLIAILLGEAAVIALAGGLTGIVAARPMLGLALALMPDTMPLARPAEIDWRVVAFALAAALLPVVAFALWPSISATRRAFAIRQHDTPTSTPRLSVWARGALLAVESAISTLLVVGGSLVLVSFVALEKEETGFETEALAVFDVQSSARLQTPEERDAFGQRVLDRMKGVPGVRDVAAIGAPVLERAFAGSRFKIPAGAGRGTMAMASDTPVSGSFFEIAGLRVLDGRVLTRQEIESGAHLAVVSDATARAYWPGARAVGQILESESSGTLTVVGVVAEAPFGSQADGGRYGEIYLPSPLGPQRFMTYLVRGRGDLERLTGDVAMAVRTDIPGAVVQRAESLDDALAKSIRLERFRTVLFSTTGAAALVLLAVGMGGLVAAGVTQRVREIGIRSALGASQSQIVKAIVIEYLRPSIAGACLGLLAAWWSVRVVAAFLYTVDPHEPSIWIGATGALLIVPTVAAWLPARRAAGVDPLVVLRAE
jgi:predicted permease